MLYGWTGQRLVADLTAGKTWVETIPANWRQQYLGGRGVNSRTLYDEVKPGVDPLGPENVLLFGVGPVNGTMVPSSGRYTVTALSPLTVVGDGKFPCFGDSNSGGFWGPELKYAGFDQLVIRGKSPQPVYLFIKGGSAEIRPAEHLWGKDTWETDALIHQETGDQAAQVACIGPAGENLVRFACIINNLFRAAGKCGMGAVMGSKNLKAVAIRGKDPVRVANPKLLKEVVAGAMAELGRDPSAQVFAACGTSALLSIHQRLGRLATRNYQNTQFEGWENLTTESFAHFWTRSKGCFACPVHCGHFYEVEDGEFKGTAGEGPEYAATAGFGSKLGNSEPAAVLAANNICNQLGIDVINSSSVIAWAMECFDRGIVSTGDTDGLDMSWGNYRGVLELMRRIAYRQGDFARLMGEGAYRASRTIGRGSEDYVVHVKGQDPGLTDPRVARAWGLGYAVASRGGCHLRALATGETFFSPEEAEAMFGSADAVKATGVKGKGRLVKWSEDHRAVTDSLETCKLFVRTSLIYPRWLKDFLAAVTGVEMAESDLMRVGERIINVERGFNLRQGLVPSDDTLSRRFIEEPVPDGPYAGQKIDLEPMLAEYYADRGWDLQTGLPLAGVLAKLDLADVAKDLGQ